jgi:hypothetical protein
MLAPAFVVLSVVACDEGVIPATPRITPGTATAPREVNIVARDYAFSPAVVDLVPGEIVVLHVVNGGLDVHEAVIGDRAVQDAWEAAEAATAGHPPGPTPVVSVAAEVAGLRIVVASSERRDATLAVPQDAPDSGGWLVGCHIPGHWARGMAVPVRFVDGSGRELAEPPAAPTPAPPS